MQKCNKSQFRNDWWIMFNILWGVTFSTVGAFDDIVVIYLERRSQTCLISWLLFSEPLWHTVADDATQYTLWREGLESLKNWKTQLCLSIVSEQTCDNWFLLLKKHIKHARSSFHHLFEIKSISLSEKCLNTARAHVARVCRSKVKEW